MSQGGRVESRNGVLLVDGNQPFTFIHLLISGLLSFFQRLLFFYWTCLLGSQAVKFNGDCTSTVPNSTAAGILIYSVSVVY
jgi:hypothetical protein